MDHEDGSLMLALSTASSKALATSAGRELDTLIAERIMGLVHCKSTYHAHDEGWGKFCFATPDSPAWGGELRAYSTEIADAWLVVEHINRNRDAIDWSEWTSAWGNIDRIEMQSSKQLAEWICLTAIRCRRISDTGEK